MAREIAKDKLGVLIGRAGISAELAVTVAGLTLDGTFTKLNATLLEFEVSTNKFYNSLREAIKDTHFDTTEATTALLTVLGLTNVDKKQLGFIAIRSDISKIGNSGKMRGANIFVDLGEGNDSNYRVAKSAVDSLVSAFKGKPAVNKLLGLEPKLKAVKAKRQTIAETVESDVSKDLSFQLRRAKDELFQVRIEMNFAKQRVEDQSKTITTLEAEVAFLKTLITSGTVKGAVADAETPFDYDGKVFFVLNENGLVRNDNIRYASKILTDKDYAFVEVVDGIVLRAYRQDEVVVKDLRTTQL
jgi:hypothetical protein